MENKELKVLLKLITKPNYRSKIGELKPNKSTSAADRDEICRSFHASNYVDLTEKITKIRITDEGKILLKVDSKDLPINPEENKVIQAFAKKDILTPGKTNTKPNRRDEIIQNLIDKGFIEAAEIKIVEVWLTEKGKQFLATELKLGGGGNITFSKKMFADYLDFIRNYYAKSSPQPEVIENGKKTVLIKEKPTDEEILKTIIDLDTKLKTDNYLPIFHLRNCFQPPLTREELNEALYRLEGEEKIQLNKLSEVTAYNKEEINAGIPQPAGGSLFFIRVNE